MPQTQTMTFNLTASPLNAGAMLKDIHTTNAFNNFVVDCISPKAFSYLATSPVPTSNISIQPNDNFSSSTDEEVSESISSDYEQISCTENSSKNYSYYFSGSENEFDYISSDDELEFVNYDLDNSDCDKESETSEVKATVTGLNNEPQTIPTPFWYQNETEDHIKVIIQLYTEKLISKKEFSRSVQPFIGSIKRYAIRTGCPVFQTFDQVSIMNNQKMPLHKPIMQDIRETYLITKWDNDGLPYEFFILNNEGLSIWREKLSSSAYVGILPAYLHCIPDFFGQSDTIGTTNFIYSSSSEFKEVGYSNAPWDSSPYSKFVKSKQSSLLLGLQIDGDEFAFD